MKKLISLFLTVFIFASTVSCAAQRVNLPEKYPQYQYADINGLYNRYEVAGEGDTVILLHGYALSVYTWRNNLDVLARNFKVYAFDWRGMGFSEKPKKVTYTVNDLVNQLIDFMDHFGIQKATLVGSSLGGAIAAYTAVLYPERVNKLVLIDPAIFYLKPPSPLLKFASTPVVSSMVRPFLGKWTVKAVLEDLYSKNSVDLNRVSREYAKALKTPNGKKPLIKFLRSVDYDEVAAIASEMPRVNKPTLIIWGELDDWGSVDDAKTLNKAITGSVLNVYPSVGHLPQEEAQELVNRQIVNFIKEDF